MRNKKQLAGKLLKTSPYKVRFVSDALDDIKKAITRSDIRGLIAIGKITKSGSNEQSKARARKRASQKKKGRQKGRGNKRGKKYSIVSRKEQWMTRVRTQREFIKLLREKDVVSVSTYRMLYRKVKGGYFRNKRHIKLYITEQDLIQKEKPSTKKVAAKAAPKK